MRKSLHILAGSLLFALFAIGCSGSSEGGGDADYNFDTGGLPPADTSTTVDADGSADTATAPDTIAPCDIAALFERNGCSASGCHGDAYRSTPPLVGNDFESRLVGQRSLRPDCHANIIDPAAPEESLILRLTDPARYDAANDCGAAGVDVAGPMWSGPMHDEAFVHAMEEEAATRGWDDAEQLLRLMGEEARAERGGGPPPGEASI
jgi:hypothetical protein